MSYDGLQRNLDTYNDRLAEERDSIAEILDAHLWEMTRLFEMIGMSKVASMADVPAQGFTDAIDLIGEVIDELRDQQI